MRPLLLSFVLVITLPTVAGANTYLSGVLPDTLHFADSPFVALADLICEDTYIEPGVEVYFTTDTELLVEDYGSLNAVGSAQDSIWLRGYDGAVWDGLTAYREPDISLDHVSISNAPDAMTMYGNFGGSVSVENCLITAADVGLSVENQNGLHLTVSKTRIHSAGHGIYLISCPEAVILVGACQLVGADAGASYGIWAGSEGVQIDSTDIRHYQSGIYAPGSFTGTVTHCTVTENLFGIDARSGEFHHNHLHGNTWYDVRIIASVLDVVSVDFQENDWGPVTTAEMNAEGSFSDIEAIYDWWDDSSRSLCDYDNWLGGSMSVESTTWSEIKANWR